MPTSTEQVVTPDLLRAWPLPEAGDSKYGRGQVVVVGGARRSPGAAALAAEAALRVGAGRLTVATAASVAPQLSIALPECGVAFLLETDDGHIVGGDLGPAVPDLESADCVLVGPGLDDADQAAATVLSVIRAVSDEAIVVVDAFGLGALPGLVDEVQEVRGRLILTPNRQEAGILLGRDPGDDEAADVLEIADRYGAAVTCYGVVASVEGEVWRVGTGSSGLATSGSGDVLGGAVAGLAARGCNPAQAAVWATYGHAAAGDRLSVGVGPLGYLARELLPELPRVLVEVGG
ncbi:NAD(P)H-hydrate dehydratase [Cnuibacter sp. UC19_7]|uniref:ADP-dependent NAD(P)H-hydrate dehydratase n=1 Tax=Cnuibacter sp. UC19_7 TaxID=3350166 RepID=UPI003670772C